MVIRIVLTSLNGNNKYKFIENIKIRISTDIILGNHTDCQGIIIYNIVSSSASYKGPDLLQ